MLRQLPFRRSHDSKPHEGIPHPSGGAFGCGSNQISHSFPRRASTTAPGRTAGWRFESSPVHQIVL